MKKAIEKPEISEAMPEYDFSQGVRGTHAARYATGTNLVLLAPDVAEVYHDSDAVNNALRTLINASRRSLPASQEGSTKRSRALSTNPGTRKPRVRKSRAAKA